MVRELVLKVTRKGQVTIPKEYRDILGIREGDFVCMQLREDVIVISKPGIPEPGQPVGEEKYREIIKQLENERRLWL